MRFTDKTTLTLTGTLFVLFRHVTFSLPASIVQLVYVIPFVQTNKQTRASQTREVSAKTAKDNLALHYVCLWQQNVLRKQRYLLQASQNIHEDSNYNASVGPSNLDCAKL